MTARVDKGEMLRYWGIRGTATDDEARLADEGINLALSAATPKCVHQIYDCHVSAADTHFGSMIAHSENLAKMLEKSKKAVVVCASAGVGIDNMMRKYSANNMALSTAIGAAGSSIVECMLDDFCADLSQKYKITPRFSPGYGDLSLDFQRDIFAALDITRKIGVTLDESCLMTPVKSVTAIIGIEDENKD